MHTYSPHMKGPNLMCLISFTWVLGYLSSAQLLEPHASAPVHASAVLSRLSRFHLLPTTTASARHACHASLRWLQTATEEHAQLHAQGDSATPFASHLIIITLCTLHLSLPLSSHFYTCTYRSQNPVRPKLCAPYTLAILSATTAKDSLHISLHL